MSKIFSFNVSSSSPWIEDIQARQQASRDSVIVRLSRLGWIQDEIAAGIDQSRVTQVMRNGSFAEIKDLLSEGRDMAYVAG